MKQLIKIDAYGKEIQSPYHYVFKTQIEQYNRKNKISKSTVDINNCKTVYIFKSAILDSITKENYTKRFTETKDITKADFIVVPKYVIYTIKRNIPLKVHWYTLYTDNTNYYFIEGLGSIQSSMYTEVERHSHPTIYPCPKFIYSELFAKDALIISVNKCKLIDDEQFRQLFRVESDPLTIKQYLNSTDTALQNLGIDMFMFMDWDKNVYDSTQLFIKYSRDILKYVAKYQPNLIAILGNRFTHNYEDWYNSSWESIYYHIDVYSHLNVIDQYTKSQQRAILKNIVLEQMTSFPCSLKEYLNIIPSCLIVDVAYKNYSYRFKFRSKDLPIRKLNFNRLQLTDYIGTYPNIFSALDTHVLTLCSIYGTIPDTLKEDLRQMLETNCSKLLDTYQLKSYNISLTITLKHQ